ncbi:MAG: PadR family transcriptional regulator [Vulcanimicrobiaceae bacterium]
MNPTAASILGFLQGEGMSGYELARRAEQSIGYFWNVTRSQLYREIKDLELRGLVQTTAAGARDKRICSITVAGRAAFARWIAREPADELIRFPLLLTLFFGAGVDPERLRNWVTLHRARHAERLERYRQVSPDVEREHPYPAMTLEFGIMYEETVLRWLDSLEIPPKV